MVLEDVDKLSKDENIVMHLLVPQDPFDRTVHAKRMKMKASTETVREFLGMITKKNRPNIFWLDKVTELAGEFKKLCKPEKIQSYSTRSDTKAELAERTIPFLKKILYRNMEEYGYKYNHKLSQFVITLIFGGNFSADLIPANAKNSDFLSILYSKPLRK